MGLFLRTYFEDLAAPLKRPINVDLLHRAAHDLRSPLSALNMIIHHFKQVSPHLDHLELLDETMSRINNIAEDILCSRKRKLPVAPSFNFLDTFENFINQAEFQFKDKINLRLPKSKLPQRMNVRGDKEDFQRILWNILHNSNDAQASYISLSYRQLTDHLILKIKDNGGGIKPQFIAKIGQKGFTTKGNGNGLGLYSSIQKLQSWSGDLKLTSQMSVGTTIEITLTYL